MVADYRATPQTTNSIEARISSNGMQITRCATNPRCDIMQGKVDGTRKKQMMKHLRQSA